MARKCIKAMIFVLMISTLLISCAAKKQETMAPALFQPYNFMGADYVSKVDDFLVILDASASMAERKYLVDETARKFTVAKEFLSAMNQTIPDLKMNGSIRAFGLHTNVSKKITDLFYGPTAYSQQGFAEGLESVKLAGGNSPLASALNAGTEDLKSAAGKIAVIIVSDGKDMGNTTVPAAQNLKDTFGDRLCIYTVLVGDDPEGESLMKKIAEVGRCGFMVRADGVKTSGDMKDFVEKVFLGKSVMVKPAMAWDIQIVYFDTDKSDIKSQYIPVLDQVADIMKKNPDLKLEIQGHTDIRGAEEYNQGLSDKRAKAVLGYLVNAGISADRMTCVGFGITKPAASNSTPEGKAKNRRAELILGH